MGIYIISKKELIESLIDCLDGIEGDFDIHTLVTSLEFLKHYPYTSDGSKSYINVWNKKLKKLEINNGN